MVSLRTASCAAALLQNACTSVSIILFVIVTGYSLPRTIPNNSASLQIFILLVYTLSMIKWIVTYKAIESSTRVITTNVLNCKCYTSEEKLAAVSQLGKYNIVQILILLLDLAVFVLYFICALSAIVFIVLAVILILRVCTLLSCIYVCRNNLHDGALQDFNDVSQRSVSTANNNDDQDKSPEELLKIMVCYDAFANLNLVCILVLGLLTIGVLSLCWFVGLQRVEIGEFYHYVINDLLLLQEILRLKSNIHNIFFYGHASVVSFLVLVAPIISVPPLIRFLAVTLHDCPEVSLPERLTRVKQWQNWNIILFLISLVSLFSAAYIHLTNVEAGINLLIFVPIFNFLVLKMSTRGLQRIWSYREMIQQNILQERTK